MSHSQHSKKKLLDRIGRIKGQLEAVARALESDQDCSVVMQQIAACRGALNGLMLEVVEDHVRFHLTNRDESEHANACDELVAVLRTYLR